MSVSTASAAARPNDLDAYWMPFTANRAFKQSPRMVTRAKAGTLNLSRTIWGLRSNRDGARRPRPKGH